MILPKLFLDICILSLLCNRAWTSPVLNTGSSDDLPAAISLSSIPLSNNGDIIPDCEVFVKHIAPALNFAYAAESTGRITAKNCCNSVFSFIIQCTVNNHGINNGKMLGSTPRITQIRIEEIIRKPGGFIPTHIGLLSELEILKLSNNHLGGKLPTELGLLQHLTHLLINDNSFVGEFPSSIGNLKHLTQLHAANNFISGALPSNLMNEKLRTLFLGNNRFSGSIPTDFALHLKSLAILSLKENKLIGPIPDSFGSLKILRLLFLENNRLSGEIPPSLVDRLQQDPEFLMTFQGNADLIYSKKRKIETVMTDSCSICLEEMVLGKETSRWIGCRHEFHEDCLSEWMKSQEGTKTCPLCRSEITFRPSGPPSWMDRFWDMVGEDE